MGQEVSKVVYQSECNHPERQVLDTDDELDLRRRPSPPGDAVEEDEFFTPAASPSDYNFGGAGNQHTVIIFDWDDTLLCSSAINRSQWSFPQLRELEKAAESALRTAMGLGETLIVTNGNSTWVRDSAERFLPKLLPLIRELTVVSARALYETQFPGNPFMWKQAAFKQLLIEDRPGTQANGLNLVALGDQSPEIEAAHFVVKNLGYPSQAKTVKFKEGPTVPELVGQLGKAELALARIVEERGSGNRGLVLRRLTAQSDNTIASAAGWRLSANDDRENASWSFRKNLTLKDLWLLFP